MGRLGLLLLCARVVFGQTPSFPAVQLTKVAGGFGSVSSVTNAGDGSGRLFVVEQSGVIRVLKNGALLPAPFLDISSRISCCSERGLLGLAFPPGYSSKQYFYVYYTAASFDITVSRFRLTSNPDMADSGSETVILTIPHRDYPNHNGGQMAFGKDGYLYLGTGDGGGGGDILRNGQNPASLLAKVLRIDVESGAVPYAIPVSNPMLNKPGFAPEIWAWGLRNPWRFSFDRANGDLYIADVGQNAYEEVNYQPAADPGGEDYGWSIMEGTHCYNAASCSTAGLTLPILDYDHSAGNCAVIGGYMYRGTRYPALQGLYIYGDYCSGRIWGLSRNGTTAASGELLKSMLVITTFGEDESGELYVADQDSGSLYAISAGASGLTSVVNAASYETGLSAGSVASLFGSGFLAVGGIQAASGYPLPASIAGTSVTVNGIPAPLYAIANVNGTEQINFQAPYEMAGSAQATVVVTTNGVQKGQLMVPVLSLQPALFTTDGVHAASYTGDGYVVVFGTGFGPVSNPPATGAAAPLSPLSQTQTTAQAILGGRPAIVLFSGLAPTFAGLYQVNVQVPPGLPSGDNDLVLTFGTVSSKAVKVRLR